MADMENWKKFFEQVTGRPYESPNREPPRKKTKTTMNRRGGSEPRAKEICTEKV